MAMATTIIAIFLLLFSKSRALFLPQNSSILNHNPPNLTHFSDSTLERVLHAIAAEERWDPTSVRVSELDPISFRVGRSQSYEFEVRVGKSVLMMKLMDDVDWRRVERDMGAFGPDSDFGWDFGEDLGSEVGGLEIEGPLELRAVGEGDELELRLPTLNFTHGYVRRILVGDGITIKVEVAQKITLFHPHDIGLSLERCLVKTKLESNQFRPLGLDSCAPLLSVQVEGSPLIVALNTRNPEAHIKTVFHTDYTIELLSEKRYNNGKFKEVPSWASGSLKSKFLIIEKALKDLLGSNMLRGGPVRLLKAKITSSNLVKFRLEVERDITENDRIWSRVEEWRTKPVVERIWFEMVARVEAGKGWKKMLVRKLTRPVRAVESSSWSNLMSNISFTEIPSIVLPPEALTLDANW